MHGLSPADQQFHLVLHPQLELLQPQFFRLFLFGKIGLVAECVKLEGITGVFFAQALILLIAGHQLLPDGLGRSAHEQVTSIS